MTKERKKIWVNIEFDSQEDQVMFVRFLKLLIKLGIKVRYDEAKTASVRPFKSQDNRLVSEMFFGVLVWF